MRGSGGGVRPLQPPAGDTCRLLRLPPATSGGVRFNDPEYAGNTRLILYNLTQSWNDTEFSVRRPPAWLGLAAAHHERPACTAGAQGPTTGASPPPPAAGAQYLKEYVGGDYESRLRAAKFCLVSGGWGGLGGERARPLPGVHQQQPHCPAMRQRCAGC